MSSFFDRTLQKFHYGDLVRVKWEPETTAVVKGSYADLHQYHSNGDCFNEYSVLPITGGKKCAWYEARDFELIREGAFDLLEKERQRQKEESEEELRQLQKSADIVASDIADKSAWHNGRFGR